jgi:hypothetical protein
VVSAPPGTVYANGELQPVISRASILAREIGVFEAEADRIESAGAQAMQGGRVVGESLDELLKVSEDPERLCPTRAEIEAWGTLATAQADRQWEQTLAEYVGTKPTRRLRFELCWDANGVIIEAQSRVHSDIISPFEPGGAADQHYAAYAAANKPSVSFGRDW